MAKHIYFANLVDKLGTGSETVDLPAEVNTVRALHVTVNRQFANPDSPISNQDETAFIAARP